MRSERIGTKSEAVVPTTMSASRRTVRHTTKTRSVDKAGTAGQGHDRVPCPFVSIRARHRAIEREVDRRRYCLDVAVFLGRDVADKIVEWSILVLAAEIEGLERVVHQLRHLAEFSSNQFLNSSSSGGVWTTGFRQVHGDLIEALNHRLTVRTNSR
jgi:hypothetical protein